MSRKWSKKEKRRIDHKKERAAERQVLSGGKPRIVYSTLGYGPLAEAQPHIPDEAPSTGTRRKKKPKSELPPHKRDARFCPKATGTKRHHKLIYDVEMRRHPWDGEMRPYRNSLCLNCGRERGEFVSDRSWLKSWREQKRPLLKLRRDIPRPRPESD